MQQLFKQVVHYMQSQQFKEAIIICEHIITTGNEHPQILMFYAIALSKTNKINKAHSFFSQLLKSYPNNIDLKYNYALVLHEIGDLASALKYYHQCIALNPNHSSANNNLGTLFLSQNQAKEALPYFKTALQIEPKNLAYTRSIAQCYCQLRQFDKCTHLLMPLLATQFAIADDYILIVDSLYKGRKLHFVNKIYSQGLKIFPNNPTLLNLAGLIETDNKKYRLAKKHLSKAQALQASNMEIQLNLLTVQAYTSTSTQNILDQLHSFVRNNPSSELAYEYAASLCENMLLQKESLYFIQKGLSINKNNLRLLFILAKLKMHRQKLKKSAQLFQKIIAKSKDLKLITEVTYQQIKLFDKQRYFQKAWNAIKKIKKLNKTTRNNRSSEASYCKKAKDMMNDFTQNFTPNREKISEQNHKIVFLIGFPRSGTTLIEKILSKHPDIQILEETNALNEVYSLINETYSSGSYYQKLSKLTTLEKNNLAKRYISSLDNYINYDNSKTVIDKMPMNGNHLALIYSLFPHAKIIFCVRHPYDVCLSCLMQDMLQVFSFKQAAKTYEKYMQYISLMRERLPLKIIEARYEDIVVSTKKEMIKLLNFIELNWHKDMKSHHENTTLANTPSYNQVNQSIYKTAQYRYKNYLPFIKEKGQCLDTWLKYYNYATAS